MLSVWRKILRIAAVGFFALLMLSFEGSTPSPRYFEITKNLEIFGTLFKELNTYYVDEIAPGEVLRHGIDAMLRTLDPYTIYIPEQEVEEHHIMATGEYGGIGAIVEKMEEGVFFRGLHKGSPAREAGFRVGDRVLRVDGIGIDGENMENISHLLRGEANTQVTLTIARHGMAPPVDVTITRKRIKVSSVPHHDMLDDTVGYIQLAEFSQRAGDLVREAFVALEAKGMRSLIIDLRNNSGGLLNEAIAVAEIFLAQRSLVVSVQGRVEKWNKHYHTKGAPASTDIPLVLLVDGDTASAAEIVAGVMQDYDRGIVVGTNTVGKGLVQTSLPLPYNTQLKITTALYYLPSGRCIQRINYTKGSSEEQEGVNPEQQTRFVTEGERVVHEERGIVPDVSSARRPATRVINALLDRRHFFHYANTYRHHHPEAPELSSFAITDEAYEDFVSWLRNKGYVHPSRLAESTQQIDALIHAGDALTAESKQQWEAIKKTLQAAEEHPLHEHREAIQHRLAVELLSRYHRREAIITYALRRDPDVMAACKILGSEASYREAFSFGQK